MSQSTFYGRSVHNHARIKARFEDFLLNFQPRDGKPGWYVEQIRKLTSNTLSVQTSDMLKFYGFENGYVPGTDDKNGEAMDMIFNNCARAIQLLYEVTEKIRTEYFVTQENGSANSALTNVRNFKLKLEEKLQNTMSLPVELRVPYEIQLIAPETMSPLPIHAIRANCIGKLIKLTGVVSKVTNVRPRLTVAAYICDSCGNYVYESVVNETYIPLSDCPQACCVSTKKRKTLTLSMRDSKFIKRQLATIQELTHTVPAGTVPKQVRGIITGNQSRTLKPGMVVVCHGSYVPEVRLGFRFNSDLNAVNGMLRIFTVKEATDNPTDDALCHDDCERLVSRICQESPGSSLFPRMAASLAPAIFGHMDIKKVLMLQQVSGVSEEFGNGLKIRGDIHVLIMGDPGIAKSQLLKRVNAVAARSHFTCGKGASGVGLTASVIKDPVTNEMTLEGGAIVLSDRGICCIDEFDKMDESDRTAIHEVMEQQTVSVSKAGLVATLNARTRILAAANPVSGRYDITRNAVANIGLPAALLSRFDVVFLTLDTVNAPDEDFIMANHILKMHKNRQVDRVELDNGTYRILTTDEIRAVIRKAQEFQPKLSTEMAAKITDYYLLVRGEEQLRERDLEELTFTTPRTLLGIIRLSQAIARLRFSNEVIDEDLTEAIRIMKASKESVALRKLHVDSLYAPKTKNMTAILYNLASTVADADGWIPFEHAVTAARSTEEEADIESVIDSMVATGNARWDSIARRKFKFV